MPLDLDAARIRLLYRIPTAPARGRALELSVNGDSILRGGNWAGEFALLKVSEVDCAKGMPFGDGSFDIVVLHRTLDRFPASARRDLLMQVTRVLSPGGLVIGCVENRLALERCLRGVRRALGRGAEIAADSESPHPMSAPGCRRALAAGGLEDITLFSMLPDTDAPRRLLSIETGWSRRACRRHLEALRPLVRRSTYLVWRVLAELGISQYLSPATFFWGRKAC